MTLKPDMSRAWANNGIVVKPDDLKIDSGWGAEKPPYQSENWLQNRADLWIQSTEERGVPAWDINVIYELNSLCHYSGQVYKSLQTANNGNQPGLNVGWWIELDSSAHSLTKKDTERSAYNTIADANLIVSSGMYTIDNGSNTPIPANNFNIMAIVSTVGESIQIAIDRSNGNMYKRAETGGVFGTWRKVIEESSYASSSIGGTLKVRVSGTDLFITNNGVNA